VDFYKGIDLLIWLDVWNDEKKETNIFWKRVCILEYIEKNCAMSGADSVSKHNIGILLRELTEVEHFGFIQKWMEVAKVIKTNLSKARKESFRILTKC